MIRITTCLALVFCGGLAQADTLITPTAVTLNTGSQFFPVVNLINNSGLSGAADIDNYTTITHPGTGAGNTWVTDANVPNYYTALPPPVMTFTLGDTYALTDVVAWNYPTEGNAARQVTATFSVDGGVNFGTPVTFEIPQAGGPAHTMSLNNVVLADHVRFTIDSNWIGFGPGGDRVGLSEIKFIATELIVPEPASIAAWALAALVAGCFFWRTCRSGAPRRSGAA